jgi:uncharacterized repeat protein (TIGR03803 family)
MNLIVPLQRVTRKFVDLRPHRYYRAVLLVCLAALGAQAQIYTNLYTFSLHRADPTAPLVQGFDGEMYGAVTESGGFYSGMVFKITTAGLLTTIGKAYRVALLVPASDGNIYGVTSALTPFLLPSIFKISPSGALTRVYTFNGDVAVTALLEGEDGNLYGTTSGDETTSNTFFRLTLSGESTILYTFDAADGSVEGLIQGADGNFYGTTYGNNISNYGTVFKISATGGFTTLHSFDYTDGANPFSGLVQASNGDFYGTTYSGGASTTGYSGTIYKISPAGDFTLLHSFDGTDGAYPARPLIQATNGNLYGSTSTAGPDNLGTMFQITPAGVLTTVVGFGSGYPLVQDTNGNLYGYALDGIFSLSFDLGPFVTTVPVASSVGSTVDILGTNLSGASQVSFNGVPAAFTVVSPAEITATVPAGATTGKINVTTPAGPLSSNVVFRVVN